MTESAITYHPETIPAFKGIPTIECLPPRLSMTDLIKDLTKHRPEYHESDRLKSPEDRGMLTQILLRLYQPCEKDIDIYNKVERCIRWGYADRNPFSPAFVQQRQREYPDAICLNMTSVTDNLHAGLHCMQQCLSELRLCFIIRIDLPNPVHLDHKIN